MTSWTEEVDFVVIGSGAGSFCAGLALRDLGKSVLVLEKTELVGGSTAMSGGVLWVPNHPLQARAGVPDSPEQARAYLDAAVGDNGGPGSSPARRDAFLKTGPQLISYLEGKGMPFRRSEGWSDYYDELPGGSARGRSLSMELFDTRELGEWAGRLRGGGRNMPIRWPETRLLMLAKRTPAGVFAAIRLAARIAIMKLRGQKLVGMGTAIQGRMLKAALAAGVDVRPNSPVTSLVEEGGRVVGVTVDHDGAALKIRARLGVLINAGGFARNAEMRKQYGPQPSSTEWTHSNPGETGEALRYAMDLGAATDQLDQAVWLVTSLPPGGGRDFHVFDISKPHIILVDGQGRRFTNESGSYMENGQQMYRNHAVPAWAIFESRHRNRYPWGTSTPPGITPDKYFSEGYMKRAGTLDELAQACELDPAVLRQTVERFNGFAKSGKDLDFKRGDRAYDRGWGDPTVKPNPCLGAIERGPFYAVKVYPGDVGTFGGLVTDEHARVLRADGGAIEGLYATGNCTASVMGACYPGAGASISASFVFGYLAARHAAHATANV